MPSYTPALDGIRGIAIILVLLHHFTIFDPITSVGAWMGFVALLGWSGVDLFFVLSGFLITGILIDARGSDRYFTSFYARRTLRIFPLYYLIVFLSLIVLPRFPRWSALLGGGSDLAQWPYWTYLVNFAIAERNDFQHGVLDVAWSLAIEEQFYLIWAVVVWLLSPRLLGPLCALIVLAVPLTRVLALQDGANPVDVYVLPHYRADALALGGLLAWLARRGSLEHVAGFAPWTTLLALVAAFGVAVADGSPSWSGAWMQRIGYSLFAARRRESHRRRGDAHIAERHAAAALGRMATGVRQVQLLHLFDPPAGLARRTGVCRRRRGVPGAVRCGMARSSWVLCARHCANVRHRVVVVAWPRGADSQTEIPLPLRSRR